MLHSSAKKELPANIILKSIFDAAINPNYANRPLKELPNFPAGLETALKAMHDALLAVREMTFEEIRRQRFPALPSRHRCIFLALDNEDSVRVWWDYLCSQGNGNRKIYEVSATGNVHQASQALLGELETRSVEEWEKMADKYWRNQPQAADDEILFEGELRVVREMSLSFFSITDK